MTDYKPHLILFHANCSDGFCAAWVLHKVYPDAEFKAVFYGEDPPDVTGRNVIIADFSYKRAVLEEMKSKAQTLRVFDHHKTALADLSSLDFCVFDMNRSGGKMVWDLVYCSPFVLAMPDDTPWIVKYTQDRDLWQWKLPHSKEINAALSSYPKTFESWDKLESKPLLELILEGTAILRYQEQLVGDIAKEAVDACIAGHVVPCVNTPVLQSEVCNKLCEGKPFAAAWFIRRGKKVFSLRSKADGVDVSEVAKRFGGGGHRQASGYEVV